MFKDSSYHVSWMFLPLIFIFSDQFFVKKTPITVHCFMRILYFRSSNCVVQCSSNKNLMKANKMLTNVLILSARNWKDVTTHWLQWKRNKTSREKHSRNSNNNCKFPLQWSKIFKFIYFISNCPKIHWCLILYFFFLNYSLK